MDPSRHPLADRRRLLQLSLAGGLAALIPPVAAKAQAGGPAAPASC